MARPPPEPPPVQFNQSPTNMPHPTPELKHKNDKESTDTKAIPQRQPQPNLRLKTRRWKQGFLLPSVSSFSANSTHYGKIMKPRANGLIVTYPNNSNKSYVYNLKEKSFLVTEDFDGFLKMLKKNDIIEKYKDQQIRINKQWLTLGSHFGAGIYELYAEDKRFGYLNSSNGNVWDVNYYNFIGGYCDGNFELLEGDKRYWLDADGVRQETNKNESGSYSGTSRFVKQSDGHYSIFQNKGGKDYLVIGDQTLLNQKQFVAESSK